MEPANLTARSDGLPRHGYNYGRTLSAQDLAFFDFEPQVASYQSQSTVADLNGPDQFSTWGDSGQLMSPPDSAVFSPKAWPNLEYLQGSPLNILTDIKSANSRTNYGQITPTDDECSEEFNQAEQQPRPVKSPPAAPEKKRKRASVVDPAPASTPVSKRVRKDRNRSEPFGAPQTDPSNPDGNRRSKFLERNRLAASKCRQKKKQWVENLEAKARNLQAQYKQLNLVVDSLRNEILYLKVEMVRHKDCEGSDIQKFINEDCDAFAEAVECLERSEREKPAHRSGSRSPCSETGRDPVRSRRDVEKMAVSDQGSASGLPLDDLNLAEALLQDEYFQDASDLTTPELVSSRTDSVSSG